MYGLLLVILLLGYGLVEVPRQLWRKSRLRTALNHLYFNTVSLYEELLDSEGQIEETMAQVKQWEQNVGPEDPWYPYIQELVVEVPL